MNKFLGLLFLGWALSIDRAAAQDPASIRNKCQTQLSEINDKMKALNDEYEKIKADLRAGYFCSKCGRSKTELDKAEGFYVHLQNVKGSPVPATAQQMEDAHKRYIDKFNSFKNDYDSKSKSCDEDYNNAVQQQNENRERERQAALNDQLARQRKAEADAERARQAELERRLKLQEQLKQQQEQLKQQQETNRQAILQQLEKNKRDAVQMFDDAANQMKNSIHSIEMPASRISFGDPQNTETPTQDRPSMANIEDPAMDDSGKGMSTNNYFNEYSDQVKDVTLDNIVSETSLPEIVKSGYETLSRIMTSGSAISDLTNGKITKETVSTFFSSTPDAVVKQIQMASGNIAVESANTSTSLGNRLSSNDFSEKDVDDAMNAMNPLHFEPTAVKSDKPWTFRDGVVVVGGGLFLSTIGAPIWIGIGAAAWYGFNR